MSDNNTETNKATLPTKDLFGDSSDDDDDDEVPDSSGSHQDSQAAPSSSSNAPKPAAATAATSNKDLFGESDDSDDDDGAEAAASPPVANNTTKAATSPPKRSNDHHGDSDDDEGDVEFDDAGDVVGLSSSTIAGQVARPRVSNNDDADADNTNNKRNKKAAAPPKTLHWTVPDASRPAPTTKLHITKLPNLVGIQTQAFDPDRYNPDDEEEHFGGAVHNLIRWRYKTDAATGHLLRDADELQRESNTRLVEWEDGSWTMHVGTEAFQVDSVATTATSTATGFAGLNGYLFLSHNSMQQKDGDGGDDKNNTTSTEVAGTILEGMGHIHSRLTVKPGLQSDAHKALTHAVRRKTIQTGRMGTVMTQDDPEKLKQDRIKMQTELAKAKERSKRPYASGGAGGSKSRPRLTRNYLEGGGDDANYDSVNIRAMKKGARDYGDEDDEDDYGDDFVEDDDDDDDGEIFNRQKPSKQSKGASKADVPVEDDSDDDDDDDEEETFVKKPAAKKNAAVFDDDDDDSD